MIVADAVPVCSAPALFKLVVFTVRVLEAGGSSDVLSNFTLCAMDWTIESEIVGGATFSVTVTLSTNNWAPAHLPPEKSNVPATNTNL